MSDGVQTDIECHYTNGQTRKKYLESVKIKVKQIEKTQDLQQLIVIHILRKETNVIVSIIVRRLNQLHSLILHITNVYGGHIIPIIKSDLYFQNNIQMQTLTPLIQQFLNDVRVHRYIQTDQKLYQFLFFQNQQFKKVEIFQKMMQDASTISKKYLNSIFTRKEIHSKFSILSVLEQTYQLVLKFENNLKEIKKLSQIFQIQHDTVQDIFANFSQMALVIAKSLPPNENVNQHIKKIIKKVQKFLRQIKQAYIRIQIIKQTVRQLKGNINKGLHDKNHKLQATQATLKEWAQSLNLQFLQFLGQGQKAIQYIASKVYQMKKIQIYFTYATSQKSIKQNVLNEPLKKYFLIQKQQQ